MTKLITVGRSFGPSPTEHYVDAIFSDLQTSSIALGESSPVGNPIDQHPVFITDPDGNFIVDPSGDFIVAPY